MKEFRVDCVGPVVTDDVIIERLTPWRMGRKWTRSQALEWRGSSVYLSGAPGQYRLRYHGDQLHVGLGEGGGRTAWLLPSGAAPTWLLLRPLGVSPGDFVETGGSGRFVWATRQHEDRLARWIESTDRRHRMVASARVLGEAPERAVPLPLRFLLRTSERLTQARRQQLIARLDGRISGGRWSISTWPHLRGWHRLTFTMSGGMALDLNHVNGIFRAAADLPEVRMQPHFAVDEIESRPNGRQKSLQADAIRCDFRERDPLNLQSAWEVLEGLEPAEPDRPFRPVVGVLGRPIDASDPFLRADAGPDVIFLDPTEPHETWAWGGDPDDPGHETAVASLVAGSGLLPNSEGMVGVLPGTPLLSVEHYPTNDASGDLVDRLARLVEDGPGFSSVDLLVCAGLFADEEIVRDALVELTLTGRRGRGCPVVVTAGHIEGITGSNQPSPILTNDALIVVAGAKVEIDEDDIGLRILSSLHSAIVQRTLRGESVLRRAQRKLFLAPSSKSYVGGTTQKGVVAAGWGPDSAGPDGTTFALDEGDDPAAVVPAALLCECRSRLEKVPADDYLRWARGVQFEEARRLHVPFVVLGSWPVEFLGSERSVDTFRLIEDGAERPRWQAGTRLVWVKEAEPDEYVVTRIVSDSGDRLVLRHFRGFLSDGDRYRVFEDLRQAVGLFGGSSAATGIFGGAVAMLMAANPELASSTIRQLLSRAAEEAQIDVCDLDHGGVADRIPCGRFVDFGAAMRMAVDLEPNYLWIEGLAVRCEARSDNAPEVVVDVTLSRVGHQTTGYSELRAYYLQLSASPETVEEIEWPPSRLSLPLGALENAGSAMVNDTAGVAGPNISKTIPLSRPTIQPGAATLALLVELLPHVPRDESEHPHRAIRLLDEDFWRVCSYDSFRSEDWRIPGLNTLRYVGLPWRPPLPPVLFHLAVVGHFDLPTHADVVETMRSGEVRTSRMSRSGDEWRAPKRVPSCTLGPLEVRRSPGPDGSPGIVAAKIDWAPTSDHASMHVIFGRSGEAIDKLPPRQRAGRTAACRVIRRSPYAFVGLTLRDVYLHGMVRESFVGASGFPQHDFDGIEVAARWLEKLGGGRLVLGSDDPTHSKLAGEFERRGRVEGVDWLPGAPGDKGERRFTAILEAAAGAVGGVILHRVTTTGLVELEHGCDRVVVLAEGAAPLMLVDPEGRAHFGDAGKELYRIVLDGPKGGSWWVESEREGRRVWVLGQPALDVDVSWPTDERPVLTARAALLDVPPVAWALYVWALDERGRRTLRGKVAGGTDDASLSVKVPDPPGAALEVEVLGDWAKGSPFRRTLRGWVG